MPPSTLMMADITFSSCESTSLSNPRCKSERPSLECCEAARVVNAGGTNVGSAAQRFAFYGGDGREGRFFFYQPELGVIASDETITRADEKFLNAKRTFLEDVDRAGLVSERPASAIPVSAPPPRSLRSELGLFLAKTCMVFLLLGVIVSLAASVVSHSVENVTSEISASLEKLSRLSLSDIAVKAADIARDAHNMPEERKLLLKDSVSALSREMGPIVDAWRNPQIPPESRIEVAPQSTPSKPDI
jgi:hypothetical protein